jgi:hypothetical protein
MRKWIGLALLLTGCVSTNPEAWTHAPDEQTRARAAIYDCKEDADAKLRWAAGFGGAIVPLVALFKNSSEFDKCMAARGYVKP